MNTSSLIYRDELPGGSHWSLTMKRGTSMRLIDQAGNANVGMLFYNPQDLLERYNAPDTLKCQHTFKLTKNHCLYSDMGRIFCSITDDTLGWHDTVCGTTSNHMVEKKWGKKNYQNHHNDWNLSGYNSFLVELAKYGLGKKDLAANLNLFSKVTTDEQGNLTYVPDHSAPGDAIELRFEMDTLVIFNTCPHPLNPATEYPKTPVVYEIHHATAVAADDPCINSRPENQRGFMNNQRYLAGH